MECLWINLKINLKIYFSKRCYFSFFLHYRYATFYHVLGVSKGDEVIVSSQTHVATAHAIESSGAKPVFIDSELNSGNLKISDIEKKIKKKQKLLQLFTI